MRGVSVNLFFRVFQVLSVLVLLPRGRFLSSKAMAWNAQPEPQTSTPGVLGQGKPALWTALLCGLLAAATLVVYWPVRHHEFINYDDPDYITENHYVRAGLTREGIEWAFTRVHGPRTYWHPLTWLSHMVDCQVFGLKAGAHHLVNVVLHALNVVLVMLILRQLTGAMGRSLVVAALFGLHPLQVDTVAWVTERKNLLSAMFFLLALWAYARYAGRWAQHRDRESKDTALVAARPGGCRAAEYALALAFFALSLMCKPAWVTLPFVLLLLDFWPLGRMRGGQFPRVLLEKIPFFALAAASSAITIWAHRRLGIVSSEDMNPLETRLINALMSYARYLRKVFWPDDLAVFYPYVPGWPAEQLLAGVVLLAGISFLVFRLRERQPYLVLGWCWFLGMLVPTIGLIQVGSQSMADRFIYVPLLGVFIMVVWGGWQLLERRRCGVWASRILVAAALLACLLATRQQIGHWQDSVTLFAHTARVTERNVVALNNWGTALLDRGELDAAEKQYRASIQADPNVPFAYYNLGHLLEIRGQRDEAMTQYRLALELNPRDPALHFKVADALARANLLDEAVQQYQAALRMDPGHAGAHNNLAVTLMRLKQVDAAMEHALQALRLDANNPEVHNTLGNIHAERGQNEQAMEHYQRALKVVPGFARAHYNLGDSLVELNRVAEAKQCYLKAAELDPAYLEPQRRLAELAASAGDWSGAVHYYSNVVQLDTNQFAAWNNLGGALAELGQFREATPHFLRALAIKPDFTNAQVNLVRAMTQFSNADKDQLRENFSVSSSESARAHYAQARRLHRQGNRKGALEHLRAAAQLDPTWREAANDAAWLLATVPESELRDASEAVRLAERASKLGGDTQPNVMGTLAAAYAEAGRFADAVRCAEQALDLAERAGLRELAQQTRARLALYRAGKPYREP